MIIEEVDAIHFLMLRLPVLCGEYFWSAYRRRVEEEMLVVLGVERVYWALRRGVGELPRRRDFSCAHRFKTLPLSALEEAQKRWEGHCDVLREACCEELKRSVKASRAQESTDLTFSFGSLDLDGAEGGGTEEITITFPQVNEVTSAEQDDSISGSRWFNVRVAEEAAVLASSSMNASAALMPFSGREISVEDLYFCKKAIPLLKLTHTIFKKVRLRYLKAECPILPSQRKAAPRRLQLDDLLDAASAIPGIIERIKSSLLKPPYHHAILCKHLTEVVETAETVIDEVKEFLPPGEQAKWFDLAHRQLEAFLKPLNEANPFR